MSDRPPFHKFTPDSGVVLDKDSLAVAVCPSPEFTDTVRDALNAFLDDLRLLQVAAAAEHEKNRPRSYPDLVNKITWGIAITLAEGRRAYAGKPFNSQEERKRETEQLYQQDALFRRIIHTQVAGIMVLVDDYYGRKER